MRIEEPDVPLSNDLLAHAGALRRLARGILCDAHAAEDVVQETWVRALERPPVRRDRLGGWLAAVTRSLAFRRVRGEGRRRAREARAAGDVGHATSSGLRAGGPGVGASTAEVAERRQALARLTAAVLALEEPYQSAVLLRFYDDLPPREVAATLGVPLATAKSRIARGLAQLRERVDADLARDGTTAQRAFAFLVGPALPVAPLPTSTSTGGTGAAAAAGAIAMGVNGKIALGIVAAAVVAAASWQGLARRSAEPVGPEPTPPPAIARLGAELTDAGGEPLAAAPPGTERAPLAGPVPDGFTDATVDPVADPYEFTLAGRVFGEDDYPVSRAKVFVGPLGGPRNIAGKTDADGNFELTWRGPSSSVEVALSVHGRGSASSGLRRLTLATGRTEIAVRQVGPRATYVRLVEFSDDSDSDYEVSIEASAGGSEYTWNAAVQLSGPEALPPAWAPELLRLGDARAAFALHPEHCPAGAGNTLALGTFTANAANLVALEGSLEAIQFLDSFEIVEEAQEESGFTLTGVARDAAGEPVAFADVRLGTAAGRGDGPRAGTAADGTFRFEGVEPGTWYARAGGGDHGRAERTIEATEGGEMHWEAWLDRGLEIRGQLVDAATSEPLNSWVVDVASDTALVADGAFTDAEGWFSIPNLPRHAHTLYARSAIATVGSERMLARAVVPGGGAQVFEIDLASTVPEVGIRIEDEDGKPVGGAEVRLWNLATGRGIILSRDDERFTFAAPLPPSSYAVEALVPGRTPLSLGPLHLAGASPVMLGTLGVEPRGTVKLVEDGRDEEMLERWIACVWEVRRDARVLAHRFTGALPGSLKLPPGRYALDLAPNPEHLAVAPLLEQGRAPAPRRLAFEVEAGSRTRLEVHRSASAAAASAHAAMEREEPEEPDASPVGERETQIVDLADLSEGLAHQVQMQVFRDLVGSRTSCTSCH